MMLCAVALATVVAVVVNMSGPKVKLISPAASVEPLTDEEETGEKSSGFDPGQRLEIDEPKPSDDRDPGTELPEAEPPKEEPPEEEPQVLAEPPADEVSEKTPEEPSEDKKRRVAEPAGKQLTGTEPQGEVGKKPPKKPPEEPLAAEPEVRDEAQTQPPVTSDGWPEPSGREVAAAEAPRHYAPRRDSSLALTVEAIGLHDVPVTNASSQQALDGGVIHFPQTPMPWDERDQKNVYLAGHRLGWPGTGSRLVFYNLDKLKAGRPYNAEGQPRQPLRVPGERGLRGEARRGLGRRPGARQGHAHLADLHPAGPPEPHHRSGRPRRGPGGLEEE